MNIIVTGATGFVGRHLVPKLRTLGHSVMEYDSKTLNRLRIVEGLQPVDYLSLIHI